MQKFNFIPTAEQQAQEEIARAEDARRDAEFTPTPVQEKPALSEIQWRNREQFYSDRHSHQMGDLLRNLRSAQ